MYICEIQHCVGSWQCSQSIAALLAAREQKGNSLSRRKILWQVMPSWISTQSLSLHYSLHQAFVAIEVFPTISHHLSAACPFPHQVIWIVSLPATRDRNTMHLGFIMSWGTREVFQLSIRTHTPKVAPHLQWASQTHCPGKSDFHPQKKVSECKQGTIQSLQRKREAVLVSRKTEINLITLSLHANLNTH